MHPLDNAIRDRINRKALADVAGHPGIVKWYNRIRDFRFVGRDDGKGDIFFRGDVLKAARLGERPVGQRVIVTRWCLHINGGVIAEEIQRCR